MSGASQAATREGPLRTCVGCRRRLPRAHGLRFVSAPDGRLVVDPLMRLPGRGVHTCADPGCLARAVKRAAFPRGLRRSVQVPDVAELTRGAAAVTSRRAHELLGLLRRGGLVTVGARAVVEVLAGGGAGLALVVLAVDGSTRTASDVARGAARAGVPVARFSTREALGRAIGRPPTGVVGVADRRQGRVLVTEVMKANMLAPGGEPAES